MSITLLIVVKMGIIPIKRSRHIIKKTAERLLVAFNVSFSLTKANLAIKL